MTMKMLTLALLLTFEMGRAGTAECTAALPITVKMFKLALQKMAKLGLAKNAEKNSAYRKHDRCIVLRLSRPIPHRNHYELDSTQKDCTWQSVLTLSLESDM
jgi:hypothetical protein